jgi:hypothetical protein
MRCLFAAVLMLASLPASAQGLKQVRDWVGGCDNTRHCTAIGLAPDNAENWAMLHFERGGAPAAGVERITLRVSVPKPRGLRWIVVNERDQTLLTLSDRHWADADSSESIDVVFEAPREIASLLGALRTAETLTLVGDGVPVGTVSLSGASAVLLWLDEQQKRLDTTTALLRRGVVDPATIQAPPAAPRAPRQAAVGIALDKEDGHPNGAALRRSALMGDCDIPEPERGPADLTWQLSDGRALAQLACFSGAYNFGSRWFVLDAGAAPQPLGVPVPQDDGTLGAEVDLINADFDVERGRLHSFAKGRGLGDCGSHGEWAWTAEGFRLVSYRSFPDCRGVTPDFWPVLWRSAE